MFFRVMRNFTFEVIEKVCHVALLCSYDGITHVTIHFGPIIVVLLKSKILPR